MKIQFCSDLHLEFEENTAFLKKNPLKVSGEFLILAGDISYLGRIAERDKWFFDWCSDNYEETWYIPGNHEFYDGTDISILESPFTRKINTSVFLLNNTVICRDGVTVLFTPLLSRISDERNILIRFAMNDFHRTVYNNDRFTIRNYNHINSIALAFLDEALSIAGQPAMIVTHHVPSPSCCSLKHNLSPLSEAFTNNLNDLIVKYNDRIRYWIFGHNHTGSLTTLGNSVLQSNPFGYVPEKEHIGFNNALFIDFKAE